MMKKLGLPMMMVMKNILIRKLLKELLITLKEDILRPIVIGKEKRYPNINRIQNVRGAMDTDLKMKHYVLKSIIFILVKSLKNLF